MMKTIFELTKITTNSKARYPIRKTKTDELGLFTTLEKAQKQIFRDVKESREYEQERLKEIAEGMYLEDEKRFGHDIVLAYSIKEHQLDGDLYWENIQTVRTYTADGKPNDENLLDRQCKGHYKGRTPDQIRFQPGDIVEVITDWQAELCVVEHAQPSVEEYAHYWQNCLEEYRKMCREKGVECKEEEYTDKQVPYHWDYSDDCYVMFSLCKGNTHFHPESPEVFRPTKSVPKSLREKLKAKYEEMSQQC